MSKALDEIRALRRDLAKGLNLVKFDVLRAYNSTYRKKVTGVKVGYFKPRFVKKREKSRNGRIGDEYSYARRRDGLTSNMDMPQSIGGNMSYTIIDPEAMTCRGSQSKERKYFARMRAIHASSKVDKIEFEFGLTKQQESQRKAEARRWKYAK